MFAGDDKSSSSSCQSADLKRSLSQLEGDAIPEGNENALLGEEMLAALLSSILREKRQALIRSPQVTQLLAQRQRAVLGQSQALQNNSSTNIQNVQTRKH